MMVRKAADWQKARVSPESNVSRIETSPDSPRPLLAANQIWLLAAGAGAVSVRATLPSSSGSDRYAATQHYISSHIVTYRHISSHYVTLRYITWIPAPTQHNGPGPGPPWVWHLHSMKAGGALPGAGARHQDAGFIGCKYPGHRVDRCRCRYAGVPGPVFRGGMWMLQLPGSALLASVCYPQQSSASSPKFKIQSKGKPSWAELSSFYWINTVCSQWVFTIKPSFSV